MGLLDDLADAYGEDENPVVEGSKTKVTAKDGHEYYKSSSANATEAPTNAGTHEKLVAEEQAAVKGLTPEQADFIMACTMHYGVKGSMLTMEEAWDKYKVTPDVYSAFISAPVVASRLKAGGILREKVEDELIAKDSVLTFEQMRTANVMLDLLDTRSDKKKLQDLKVATITYQGWLRQPAFRNYLAERAESYLGASQHEAALALVDKIRQGDIKAIQYFHEYTGKFSRTPQAVGGNNGMQQGDVATLIARLIEIVVEECDGPTAARIADKIKGLTQSRQLANELTDSIVVPEAIPMRDDTELLKEIKHHVDENQVERGEFIKDVD